MQSRSVLLPQHRHTAPHCEVCAHHGAGQTTRQQAAWLPRHTHKGPDCETCDAAFSNAVVTSQEVPTGSIVHDAIVGGVLGSIAGAVYGAAFAFALFLALLVLGDTDAMAAAFGLSVMFLVFGASGWSVGLLVGGLVGGLRSSPG